MGLADGAGEARHIHHHTTNDNDEDKAGSSQPEITFLHICSFE
jgi:hypothetical protein